MKAKELKERAELYGFQSLSNEELIQITGYKGTDFFSSQGFKAFKELMRRQEAEKIKKINSSTNAYNTLSFLENNEHEEFWVIFLRRNSAVIKTEFIGKGNATATTVNIQLIIKTALNLNAQSLILAHNHPSGELRPSDSDVRITKTVKEAANYFEISVLDHLIIGNGKGENKYYSFADEGNL